MNNARKKLRVLLRIHKALEIWNENGKLNTIGEKETNSKDKVNQSIMRNVRRRSIITTEKVQLARFGHQSNFFLSKCSQSRRGATTRTRC